MIDFMNEELVPLADCTPEQIVAIIQSARLKGLQRLFNRDDDARAWVDLSNSSCLIIDGVYRTKPVQMQIDWSHVNEKWNHMRIDKSGRLYFYECHPDLNKLNYEWFSKVGASVLFSPNLFASFQRGTLPWNEAICDRPGVSDDD